MKKTYETMEELIGAFESGELDRERHIVMIDNDCLGLASADEEDHEAEDFPCLDVHPADALEQLLDHLEIKHENV